MSYLLPDGETRLDGGCSFAGRLCAWTGPAAYHWTSEAGWAPLSDAPVPIDSGFELRSGLLAGADTHVGFLPHDASDWAGWVDLSTFSEAHPMYGDLLFCTDPTTGTYALFEISSSGLDPLSQFGSDELTTPLAGWSPPNDPDRVLLLGEDGLWALDPPYTDDGLQHLVSFDGADMPPLSEIPAPFQPGAATVVVPRRTHSALRLDLSDGTGTATGLKHVPGGTALWTAYLRDDRAAASRLLAALAALPAPPDDASFQLHDVLTTDATIRAVTTSAGLWPPAAAGPLPARAAALQDAPFDRSALATWALWLDWDGALEFACRQLCNAATPDYALAESLRTFAGPDACRALFDLLRSPDPPAGPDGAYTYPTAALRALVAPFGEDAADLVSSALSAASVPARAAACAVAGATRADGRPDASSPEATSPSAFWTETSPLPEEALRENARHDHPAVRDAARDTCDRLSIALSPTV
jgi:hypothetical protein